LVSKETAMPSVLVLFHSQEFGNTRAMAEAVGEGARKAGADVRLVNTNEQRLDMETYRTADGVAFGSPDYYSYIAGGLKVFLDDWHIAKQANPQGLADKPYALFYSHGGGGKVRAVMEKLFGAAGRQVGQTVESHGAPNAEVLEACRRLGRALAEAAAKA